MELILGGSSKQQMLLVFLLGGFPRKIDMKFGLVSYFMTLLVSFPRFPLLSTANGHSGT